MTEPIIDTERLASWMDDAALPGKGEPLRTRLLSGGTQNVIYELTRGEERCVIQMPPPGAPHERDRGILREWRIIAALDGTEVPHTRAVGVCEDASVLGRPFYLMGFVDGWSPMDTHGAWPEPFNDDVGARAGLSYQLAEGIALLSRVDWKAQGLADLGRPDGFHERQVDRWTGLLDRIKARELPGLDVATAWLQAHAPLDFLPGSSRRRRTVTGVRSRRAGPNGLGGRPRRVDRLPRLSDRCVPRRAGQLAGTRSAATEGRALTPQRNVSTSPTTVSPVSMAASACALKARAAALSW